MPILLFPWEYISRIWLLSPRLLSPNLLEKINFWNCLCFSLEVYIAHVFPNLETFLNFRVFLHILCHWILMVCIRSLSVNLMQELIECPKPHPCYTLVSVNLCLSKASHHRKYRYVNKRCAIFCILKPFFYLISAFVSESFQFINTTAVVRVVLEFNKTAVNQSISCRTDDPNASTILFFNFQEQPVGGRISLDKQVYTIHGVKETDRGIYQCKATSSQAGVGPISQTVVFIVDEGKWLSCILSQLITGQCMWKRGKSLCILRGYSWYWNDSFCLHIFLFICLRDTKTTYCSCTSQSGMSSFWFSFPMKLSFTFEISFLHHVNWKQTLFWI